MLVVLVLSKKCSYLIVRPDILPVNAQLDQATDKLVIFSSIRNLDKIYRIHLCTYSAGNNNWPSLSIFINSTIFVTSHSLIGLDLSNVVASMGRWTPTLLFCEIR